MKKITVLLFFCFILGCEEEAREFDFSKNLGFDFLVDQPGTTAYDTTTVLDFAGHSAIDDYEKYAEGYKINGSTFTIETLTGNVATSGTFYGSVLVGGVETELFSMEDLSLTTSEQVLLNLSSVLLQQLTNEINQTGQLNFSMTYTGDQQPGSIIFYLYFDTTVSAQLDF